METKVLYSYSMDTDMRRSIHLGTTGFEEKKAPGLERPALAVKGSNPSLACLDAEDFQPLFRQQLLKQGIQSRRVDSGYPGYAKPFPFLLRTGRILC